MGRQASSWESENARGAEPYVRMQVGRKADRCPRSVEHASGEESEVKQFRRVSARVFVGHTRRPGSFARDDHK